jgi:H/ACA ribonucleoprotein complex subunit 3
MSQGVLRRCVACHAYTLQEACPHCGGKTQTPRPPRYSPEDRYGEYRRRLKALDAAERTGKKA